MEFLSNRYRSALSRAVRVPWMVFGVALMGIGTSAYLLLGGAIGSEFLPHLDEGAIWVRGTLAPSTGPSEGVSLMHRARRVLASFPGGHGRVQSDGTTRRRYGRHRLLQHRILRRSEAERSSGVDCFTRIKKI